MPTYNQTASGGALAAGLSLNTILNGTLIASGGALGAGASSDSITESDYRYAFARLRQGDIRYFLRPDGTYERRSIVRVNDAADNPVLMTNKGNVVLTDVTITPSEYASRLRIVLDSESIEVDRNILNSIA